jgi:hypothetical protein
MRVFVRSLLFVCRIYHKWYHNPCFQSRVYDMSFFKSDLPQLDYTTRFFLWQVKIRDILTQTSDLDEVLE